MRRPSPTLSKSSTRYKRTPARDPRCEPLEKLSPSAPRFPRLTPHPSCVFCRRNPASASLKGTMRLRSPCADSGGAVSDFTRFSSLYVHEPVTSRDGNNDKPLARRGSARAHSDRRDGDLCFLSSVYRRPPTLRLRCEGPLTSRPQGLRSALQRCRRSATSKSSFATDLVGEARTSGAAGDLTLDEALKQLLTGTGLTLRISG